MTKKRRIVLAGLSGLLRNHMKSISFHCVIEWRE